MAQAGSHGDEVVLYVGELGLKLVVVVGEFGVGVMEFSVGLQ